MSAADDKPMTKGEREELKRLARERARVAKHDASRRAADLKAMVEEQLGTRYEWDRVEVWQKASDAAEEAAKDANEVIAEACRELGIPSALTPLVSWGWRNRGELAVRYETAELRRQAHKRIDAMERLAVHEIDRKSLEIQTELVAAGLTTDRAVSFLGSMPAVDELMPTLDVTEFSVERPPELGPGGDDVVF